MRAPQRSDENRGRIGAGLDQNLATHILGPRQPRSIVGRERLLIFPSGKTPPDTRPSA